MPNNYILLETIALTQSAASVTFDNLPTSGYTDLKVVASVRGDLAAEYINNRVSFNGSTSGYTSKLLYGLGTGSGASTNNAVTNAIDYSCYSTGTTATANTFSNVEIYIPNYRGSTNKSVSIDAVTENNATAVVTGLTAGLWSNTSAITSIAITASSGNFVANSTFSLYGIAAFGTTPALAPKATGGNRVENDGTYWIHTFLTSGVFTPQTGLTCDVLVVAGGGGGGGGTAGGGGAGGYRTSSGLAVTTINYPVTIGAGGATGASASSNGTAGGDSVFSTITSAGGGAGSTNATIGGNGGSGGGGGGNANIAGGTATPAGQGNNGGAANSNSGAFGAGGGGGAGAVGGTGTNSTGGAGGNGSASSISGSSVTYAGGGGGGAFTVITPSVGGTGGGGAGGVSGTAGTSGTASTGGGGGGGGANSANGAAGGSGIVIIRYPIA
jgi:hypothetical protein